jgi:hypothetical protein
MRKRVIVTLVVIALATILLLERAGRGSAEVKVINCANEAVTGGTVTVDWRASDIGSLEVGQTKYFSFPVVRESHYSISVQFRSGKSLYKEVGYLTWGAHCIDEIAIGNEDVLLTRKQSKKTGIQPTSGAPSGAKK